MENLTIDEFINRTEGEEDKKVITCHEHKTGLQGVVDLVITKDNDDLPKNIHQHIPSNDDTNHLFFLTSNGRRYTQVYHKLKDAVATTSKANPTLPKQSKYRVVVRTNASKDLPDHMLRNVTKHMSHSSRECNRTS